MNKCPYEELYETATHTMKSKPCNKPAKGVWCQDHAYVAELLKVAEALDYPRYTLAFVDNKPCYTVNDGKSAWEGYARRHPKRKHSELIRRLRQELARRLEMVA
jgi:hypothetical protein